MNVYVAPVLLFPLCLTSSCSVNLPYSAVVSAKEEKKQLSQHLNLPIEKIIVTQDPLLVFLLFRLFSSPSSDLCKALFSSALRRRLLPLRPRKETISDCLGTLLLHFRPSLPPSSLPSLPSSPQSHVCAPRFIPGSLWRGVPCRAQRGAGQPGGFRRGSDSLPADQRGGQRLLTEPHGECRSPVILLCRRLIYEPTLLDAFAAVKK